MPRSRNSNRRRRGVTYSGQKTTHDTDGLPGYPAIDLFAKPGTPFLAPENGRIVRLSGRGGTSGQVYGYSIYFQGVSGRRYFITHLNKARAPLGSYKAGQVIGTISAWSGGATHAHVGMNDDRLKAQPAYGGFSTEVSTGQKQPEPAAEPQTMVSPPTGEPPPNAPPINVPPMPELPGSTPQFAPRDPSEAWKLIAAQSLASPEAQRWARLTDPNA
jgi:murein DD-endopeptidase MepM/ murein hydrolase activator NlpD